MFVGGSSKRGVQEARHPKAKLKPCSASGPELQNFPAGNFQQMLEPVRSEAAKIVGLFVQLFAERNGQQQQRTCLRDSGHFAQANRGVRGMFENFSAKNAVKSRVREG